MKARKFYNPQTNIFDHLTKNARTNKSYDDIWQNVKKCVFCDLKDKFVIFEKCGVVLTANLYPYTNAHLLIVPRRHIEYVKEFTQEEWEALRGIMYVSKKILKKIFKYKNIWYLYREGAAGRGQKTVAHLHIHVIPYQEGLVEWKFMPINWAPSEVRDKIKEESKYMDERYRKYVEKYGGLTSIERRVVVNCLIKNSKNEILLVKKKISLKDEWETPAGSVEGDENLIQALKREMKEEVNLEVKNIKFVSIEEDKQKVFFEEGFEKDWRLIFINYTAQVKSGKTKAGDDAQEAKWVSLKNLKKYKLSKVTRNLLKNVGLI